MTVSERRELDRVIKDYEVEAERDYEHADYWHTDEGIYIAMENRFRRSAEEEEQIAEWLKEYREMKLKEARNDQERSHIQGNSDM